MATVKDFYNSFSFQDMVLGSEAGEPPQLLKDFFSKDVEYIQEHLEEGKDVLEVGCGFGRLLTDLSKRSKSVVGIDFSSLQAKQAQVIALGLKDVKVLEMHAEAMAFGDATFDLSLCMNCTLGNMPNIEKKVIHEMVRVTRPGGKVVVRVFADTDAVRAAQHKNYERLGLKGIRDEGFAVVTDEGFYSRRFDVSSLLGLFEGTGLTPSIQKDCEAGYLVEALR